MMIRLLGNTKTRPERPPNYFRKLTLHHYITNDNFDEIRSGRSGRVLVRPRLLSLISRSFSISFPHR